MRSTGIVGSRSGGMAWRGSGSTSSARSATDGPGRRAGSAASGARCSAGAADAAGAAARVARPKWKTTGSDAPDVGTTRPGAGLRWIRGAGSTSDGSSLEGRGPPGFPVCCRACGGGPVFVAGPTRDDGDGPAAGRGAGVPAPERVAAGRRAGDFDGPGSGAPEGPDPPSGCPPDACLPGGPDPVCPPLPVTFAGPPPGPPACACAAGSTTRVPTITMPSNARTAA